MQDSMEQLDDLVVDPSKKAKIGALEACDVDQNKAVIKDPLCSILNSLLSLIFEEEYGSRRCSSLLSFMSSLVKTDYEMFCSNYDRPDGIGSNCKVCSEGSEK